MWIHSLASAINDIHQIMLPTAVKTSGFFAPLNCFGQQNAVNNALVEMERAANKATIAADQTFLVKPVNIPMPQALNSSRLLVVHNDAAAKAAAHLQLAVKNVCLYPIVSFSCSSNHIKPLEPMVYRLVPLASVGSTCFQYHCGTATWNI